MSPSTNRPGAGSFHSRVFIRLGASAHIVLGGTGSVAWLGWRCLMAFLHLRTDQFRAVYHQTRNQLKFTALDALPLACLTALLLGGITLIQVFGQFSSMGAENYLSHLLAQLVIRELGPLLVGVIVIGRSGTAIAAELASMRLKDEVDALWATGVNPLQYLLVPRILGAMISVFTLIVCFDTVALLGGFIVAYLRMPLSFTAFMHALGDVIGAPELLVTLLKGLCFGGFIALFSAYFGLRVHHSTTEIPQAVTKGAVSSLVAVFISGALLSLLIYG